MTKLDPAPEAPTVPAARFPDTASGRRHPSSLPVLMCGVFMIVLDFFVVNVALPSMQADLHAGASAIEWVIAGYGLTSAVFLIAAGLALFVLASAGCGLAPNPSVVVVARLAQGVAALISPNVLAIMGVAFPGAARARAMMQKLSPTEQGVLRLAGELMDRLADDPAGGTAPSASAS